MSTCDRIAAQPRCPIRGLRAPRRPRRRPLEGEPDDPPPLRAASRRRRWRSTLAALSAARLLAACGGGGATGRQQRERERVAACGAAQDVTFLNILPLESLTFTPELVASSCGYFKKHGLNVTFQTTQGSRAGHPDGARRQRADHPRRRHGGHAGRRREARCRSSTSGQSTRPAPSASSRTSTTRSSRPRTSRTGSWARRPRAGRSESSDQADGRVGGHHPDEVKTQVVGLAPGVFDLVKSGRIGGYVVSLDTAALLAAAAARTRSSTTPRTRQERRPGLRDLAGPGQGQAEAGPTAQVPRRDQGRHLVRRRRTRPTASPRR